MALLSKGKQLDIEEYSSRTTRFKRVHVRETPKPQVQEAKETTDRLKTTKRLAFFGRQPCEVDAVKPVETPAAKSKDEISVNVLKRALPLRSSEQKSS